MRITPEKSAPTPARILARQYQMAETAEEAEMRELEEGVARLNDAGAPLLNSLVCHFDCIVQVEFRRHFSRIQNCYWLYSYVWC